MAAQFYNYRVVKPCHKEAHYVCFKDGEVSIQNIRFTNVPDHSNIFEGTFSEAHDVVKMIEGKSHILAVQK